jgi:hypothetical protein
VVCAGVVCFGVARLVPDVLSLGGCVNATAPAVSAVSTDAAKVSTLFPQLTGVQAVHWQSRESRPRTCPDIGPMDYFYEGLVVMRPDAAVTYRTGYGWAPAAPDIRPALRQYAPGNADWRQSRGFHDAVAGAADVSSYFFVDLGSGTVYFTTGTS